MNGLARLGEWVRALRGWRLILCAMALGAVSALAFAPIDFFPVLLLGFAGLALLLDGALESPHRLRAAAATGWAFAFGQFLVGLHWIAYPFMVDPASHLWQLPFAVSLMPAGLGLFGAMAVLPAALTRQGGIARLLLLAIGYAVAEWLRGHVLTGFPWNLPAYGWGAVPQVMQAAALLGSYGLSFLTILLGVSLAALVQRRFVLPGAMVLLFAGLWGYGALQLVQPSAMVPGVSLRLVQPNVPQREMRMISRNWQRLIRLSDAPGHPTHIIWPESAAAFPLARSPAALEWIKGLTANATVLMTGTVRVGGALQDHAWYNSLYGFGTHGAQLFAYDKTHLVPFGEYTPLPKVMNALGVSQLIGIPSLTPGNGRHRYAVPGAPNVTPLICYEAIFPGAVAAPEGRAGWFVNVTDDSWFGPWAGPAQHLMTARMRTIEEGVPMARAANTGISAVIDAHGRIIGKLGLNQAGVVDTSLPVALAPTPYSRFGDWGFVVLLIVSLGMAIRAPRH